MRPKRTTSKGYQRARELRNNLTPAEIKLWQYLRNNNISGIRFRRQHAIGPYIADFCAPGIRLIIELDGSQHMEQAEYDNERTAFLKSCGYKVIRFWNNDIINDIDGVLYTISAAIDDL